MASQPPHNPNPQIHTYHCLCTHLLLASTTPLAMLSRRSSDTSLDKAHILPLPTNPTSSHYAYLASTIPDRKAQIIKSDNGFEKRYLHRCGRCGIVVGYQLDWGQFEGEGVGKREDVVYLLPGGLLSTEDMRSGKDLGREVEFEGIVGAA